MSGSVYRMALYGALWAAIGFGVGVVSGRYVMPEAGPGTGPGQDVEIEMEAPGGPVTHIRDGAGREIPYRGPSLWGALMEPAVTNYAPAVTRTNYVDSPAMTVTNHLPAMTVSNVYLVPLGDSCLPAGSWVSMLYVPDADAAKMQAHGVGRTGLVVRIYAEDQR